MRGRAGRVGMGGLTVELWREMSAWCVGGLGGMRGRAGRGLGVVGRVGWTHSRAVARGDVCVGRGAWAGMGRVGLGGWGSCVGGLRQAELDVVRRARACCLGEMGQGVWMGKYGQRVYVRHGAWAGWTGEGCTMG